MLRTLATKELRETGLIALAALAVYAYFLTGAMGFRLLPFFPTDTGVIPFLAGIFPGAFIWVSGGLAIALGFRQSMWETTRNTWLFLLQRPAPWLWLIGVKLVVGLILYLVCAATPVLLYAWWAATPGTHASPFEWSMTWPTWRVWFTMSAIYLAAFLCGIRPAHWLWSRLWPLAGTAVLVFLIQWLPWWPILGLGAVVCLDVLLLAAILAAARDRDY